MVNFRKGVRKLVALENKKLMNVFGIRKSGRD